MIVILEYSDLLPYGKYKGRSVAYVAEMNPSYILWWAKSVSKYPINPEVIEELEVRKHYQRLRYSRTKKIRRARIESWGDEHGVVLGINGF